MVLVSPLSCWWWRQRCCSRGRSGPMPGDAALELLIESKAFVSPAGLRHIILHDIGLTVPPGQIVALLGRSGGGKSTLLRITSGLDTAFEGHVRRPPGRL